jgi:predicted DNA-binding transcriptional regulator YafY
MKSYDKTLTRLILILTKLSNNELPTINALAEEFNVGIRTIQRDIYQRLIYFPIEKNSLGCLQFIDGFTLDRCSLENDEMFLIYLAMSQVKNISGNFEGKINNIFSKLLNPAFSTPYFMKAQSYEKVNLKSKLFQNIEESITNNLLVDVVLKNRETQIKPYKILTLDGIWHLLARDMEDDKIKIFIISQIGKYKVKREKFKLETDIESVLNNVHSSWFNDGNNFSVKVEINNKVSSYFKAKNVLPTQEIIEEKSCGGLIVKFNVTHYEDIDNIIKAWLPDIKVIEPTEYKEKFEEELRIYLGDIKSLKYKKGTKQ